MKYNTFGTTGLEISEITYGGIVSTMGEYSGYVFDGDGQAASDQYVQYAIESGINYFDVAPGYGDAQEKLGNSLRGVRQSVYLACKTHCRDYDSAARDFERSLKLLQTDYFDNYQLHALSSMEDVDQAFSTNGVMRLMEEVRKSGTVRHLGITAHSENAALKAIELYPFETLLFPFNWQMNMATGYGNRVMEKARGLHMGILGMKSMIERAFVEEDTELRRRWPKSWCKPFDPVSQSELLIAAMKYSRSLGVNTLIPAGDIEHFRFAVEHADIIWDDPLSDVEESMLRAHLETVRDRLFMRES